jgi:hypothetical protein
MGAIAQGALSKEVGEARIQLPGKVTKESPMVVAEQQERKAPEELGVTALLDREMEALQRQAPVD